ncbi:MAG: tetratricopeptide repeat protein [Bacteroidetes bacterium]|nr:tetratricopeptide repeat protein [Bacteroidota bacterium]
MKHLLSFLAYSIVITVIATGCGSNPNIEGARLELRNKDYPRALRNINRALINDPDNSEALVVKGDIIAEMLSDVSNETQRTEYIGELNGAYAQAVLLDPDHLAYITRQRSTLYANEFGLAMETFKDAGLLAGRERANLFDKAARYFRNASMISPDSINALINEAHAFYNAGKAQDAVDAYESVIALGHTDRELFIYLARTHELMAMELSDPETQPEHYGHMIRVLKIAKDLYPKDEEIRKLLLNAYSMSEITPDALPFFEEVYQLEQQNPVFLYNYGTLLLRQEDYEGAIKKLSDAISLDSSYVNAHFNLGAAYVNHGVSVDQQYQAVVDSLQRSHTQNETNRLENRQSLLKQSKDELFNLAIQHLEITKQLMENDLEDVHDVCHALFIAYAQTNQRSNAEEARVCASQPIN